MEVQGFHPTGMSSCLRASSYPDHEILMFALNSKYLPNVSMKTEGKQELSVLANMTDNIHQCLLIVIQAFAGIVEHHL